MTGEERYVMKCEVLISLLMGTMEYDPTLLAELVEDGFVSIIGLTPYLTDVGKKAAVVLQKVFKFVDDLDMSTLEPKEGDC